MNQTHKMPTVFVFPTTTQLVSKMSKGIIVWNQHRYQHLCASDNKSLTRLRHAPCAG